MKPHKHSETVEGRFRFFQVRIQVLMRHSELRQFTSLFTSDLENIFAKALRPTASGHVLRIPVYDPSNPNSMRHTAPRRPSARQEKVSYRDILSKSDSDLVPLLSAATRPHCNSVSIQTSDHEGVSSSLHRSSISSEFDLDPVVGNACGITHFVPRIQLSQHQFLDGMYIKGTLRKCQVPPS